MSEAAALDTHAHEFHDELEPSLTPGNSGKLGMWVFLAGDAMTFGAGIAAYGALRWYNVNWPNPADWLGITLTAVMTFILICSSLTMVEALDGVKHGNMGKMRAFLGLTVVGGLIFLGCQAFEWHHLIWGEGLSIKTSLFSATFFILTGFHGMHVSGGVIYLATVLLSSLGKEASFRQEKVVEVAGLYWHFVDL
ncbi:MAG TPA: heme-copper oxidase subunit III, partial [Candidatus Binataceae bacterium]|nr:heme-copper oxidase subunit III [Candidatus Binataceae bacterium]